MAMEAALCQLRRGGTLVLVGTGMQPPTLDPNRILLNELVVTGAYEYDAGGFDEALNLLASGGLDLTPLLAPDDVPLTSLLTAMEDLAAGHIAGKVLVAPGLPDDEPQERP
jgi:threonine dehydrogenase-like Zn-dependent dehydrogenase